MAFPVRLDHLIVIGLALKRLNRSQWYRKLKMLSKQTSRDPSDNYMLHKDLELVSRICQSLVPDFWDEAVLIDDYYVRERKKLQHDEISTSLRDMHNLLHAAQLSVDDNWYSSVIGDIEPIADKFHEEFCKDLEGTPEPDNAIEEELENVRNHQFGEAGRQFSTYGTGYI